MNFYQKFYTNQIHSSSLLCQLATMWKSQVLCDAIIRTGPVITKAHRVVLVAACPMLQSMDNASMGNHLEVRLAADIKQDSINTFLQYLYEGFMMLTEENCRDVEKIARLLQVDSVIKCCADFQKCLNSVTGAPMSMDNQYKYTSYDMLEFRHVRSSNLQKSYHDRHMKRMSDFPRPSSPGSKRQRMAKPSSPLADSHSSSHRVIDDTLSMAHSYRSSAPDPWERIPRPGMNVSSRSGVSGQPGVIDIVEDCLEIIQTEDPEKDTRGNVKPDSRPKQKTVSIGVSSQINTNTDVHIVNVTEPGGSHGTAKPSATESARGSITVNPLSMFNDSASSSRDYGKQSIDPSVDVQMSPISLDTDHLQQKNESYVPTPPQQPVFPMMTPISQTTSKPFAAGSSTQISASSPAKVTENADPEQKQNEGDRDDSGDKSPSTSADKAPDISIVKIEAADGNTGGLDMYVDMPDEGSMRLKSGLDDTMDREDDSDTEHDQSQEWIREEMSNEGSNISGEQNNSWYIGQFKDESSLQKMEFSTKDSGQSSHNSQFQNFNEPFPKQLVASKFLKQQENVSRLSNANLPRYKVCSSGNLIEVVKQKSVEKGKPGPKPTTVRIKFYLLPQDQGIPKLSKKDPVILRHQQEGFGYPASCYSGDFNAIPCIISLNLTEEQFKSKIRSLYHPKLEGKDFDLYTMDSSRQLRPAPFSTSYFKTTKYKGTAVIRIKQE